MPINADNMIFKPNYILTPKSLNSLLRIEAVRERALHLSISSGALRSLRETARLYTAHYSTMIEGNRLNPEQIKDVIQHKGHFPGRERDENEIKGYYAALNQLEQWAAKSIKINEKAIQTIHALVMGNGRIILKPTPYRDGQNVIRDGRTGAIVYLPPESKDVATMMSAMVKWINANKDLPCPIVAGIAHYQFATIHPYYDGNGRTARLLTTLILHLGGYDLKGIYSLEEYYARNIGAYYEAISVGEHHNYYLGRAEAEISKWVEYFLEGMAYSFESVIKHMKQIEHAQDGDVTPKLGPMLNPMFNPMQRKVLDLFLEHEVITAKQIGELFGFKPRTCSALCAKWVKSGFLKVMDNSRKGRKYGLGGKL